MSCHLTEKISLLIDGELGALEAAELTRHLSGCALCQLARADFLHLRQQLSSIEAAPDLILRQQEALRNILAAHEDNLKVQTASKKFTPSLMPAGFRERLAQAFSPQRYSPAMLSALALLLVGFLALAAYLSLRNHRLDEHATDDSRVATRNENAPRITQGAEADKATAIKPSPEPEKIATNVSPNNDGLALKTRNSAGGKAGRTTFTGLNRTSTARSLPVPDSFPATNARPNQREPENTPSTQSGSEPVVESATIAANLPNTHSPRIDRYSSGSQRDLTVRHVEQAQLLLRAFRNARLSVQDPASDIAYEKARSKKLLFQNIMLRREAASAGNQPIEKLLSRLEPILIDIANLPARPADDDVRSIKDRMQKKNIVAMLQVTLTPASRFN